VGSAGFDCGKHTPCFHQLTQPTNSNHIDRATPAASRSWTRPRSRRRGSGAGSGRRRTTTREFWLWCFWGRGGGWGGRFLGCGAQLRGSANRVYSRSPLSRPNQLKTTHPTTYPTNRSYDEFGRLKRRGDSDRAAREAAALARLGGSHAPSSMERGGGRDERGGYGGGGGGRDERGGDRGYERERERDHDRRGGDRDGEDRDRRGRDYDRGRR
jgi:hypothetical protein